MSSASVAYVYRPVNTAEVVEAWDEARRLGLSVALKGTGNSYGDAFQSPEGVVVDFSRMKRILDYDPARGVIRCEPGVTIDALWKYVIGDGWWPPVVSGTSKVTLGGALAANIHGKNNLKAGPIGEHVLSFDLLTPDGANRRHDASSDVFRAAIGGFGLLGAFTAIELQLKRVYSGKIKVRATSVANWSEAFLEFEMQRDSDYVVGWIDGFASGEKAGRGLIHAATNLAEGEDPHPEESLSVAAQSLPDTVGWIPKSRLHRLMSPLANRVGMRVTNALKHRAGRREHGRVAHQTHASFNFLLDSVPNWKLAYKPGGLIQYQCFVPEARAREAFDDLTSYARDRGHPPFLAVMKRHRRDAFLLTHSVDGFSLALDFPVTHGNRDDLWAMAHEMDAKVLGAGGRFYFAKDATLTRRTSLEFLGEGYEHFRRIKMALDPENLLQSALSKRVFGDLRDQSPEVGGG